MESLLFRLASGYALKDTLEVVSQDENHVVLDPLPDKPGGRTRRVCINKDVAAQVVVMYVSAKEDPRGEGRIIDGAPPRFIMEYGSVLDFLKRRHGLPDYVFVRTEKKKQQLCTVGIHNRRDFEQQLGQSVRVISFLFDVSPHSMYTEKRLYSTGTYPVQRRHNSLPMIVDPTCILKSTWLAELLAATFVGRPPKTIDEDESPDPMWVAKTAAKLKQKPLTEEQRAEFVATIKTHWCKNLNKLYE